MTNINEIILKNFNENILYIQHNHPSVYEKLSALDSAIENGHYQEKYELIYENDNFDVLEKSTNTYLYSKKSSEHAIKSTESVDFTLKDNLFEAFNQHTFTQEELIDFKNDKTFQSHLPSIAPIIDYTNKHSSLSKTLNSLDKFIFFGVGLGLHVDEIHKKIKSKIYLIIEDDLELFRLSLFTINYKEITNTSKIYFSIFEEQNEYEITFNNFLQKNYQDNNYIKYFHLLSHGSKCIDSFQVTLNSQAHLRFLFNDLFKQYMHPLSYVLDGYSFLNKNIDLNKSSFENIPFLLLTMGPSLEKNINWIKNNHNKCITIAVSSSLTYLEKEDITPNIIIHTDPFELGDILFKNLKSIEFIKNSMFIFSSSTPNNISSFIQKESLYFFETGTSYKDNTLKLSSPCVGSMTYQLLLVLNANPIYLLGLDMAVDNYTNATHSTEHKFYAVVDNNNTTTDYKDSLIEVAGNKTITTKTTPHFNASLQAIEYFAPKLKSNEQSIFNLSSGARISCANNVDTTNLINENINFLDIQKKFKEFLDLSSTSTLSVDDINHFKEKLAYALRIKNNIMNGIDIFNIQASLNIHTTNMNELDKIIDSYLRYILVYISDFFNTEGLDHIQEHTNNLNSLISKELLDIIQHYITLLENKLNYKGLL